MKVEILEKKMHLKALVESESHKGASYTVTMDAGEWRCSCPDFTERGNETCKHISAAMEEIA